MVYEKFHIGSISVGKTGKAQLITEDSAVGKIIKVRVVYNKKESTAQTTLRLLTIEGEEVVILTEHNKDIVVYPRHSYIRQEMAQIAISESEPRMERFVSVGPIVVKVESPEKGKMIDDIILTLEN